MAKTTKALFESNNRTLERINTSIKMHQHTKNMGTNAIEDLKEYVNDNAENKSDVMEELRDVIHNLEQYNEIEERFVGLGIANGMLLTLYVLETGGYAEEIEIQKDRIGHNTDEGLEVNKDALTYEVFMAISEKIDKYLPMNLLAVNPNQNDVNDRDKPTVRIQALVNTKHDNGMMDQMLDEIDYGPYIINEHDNKYDVIVYDSKNNQYVEKDNLTEEDIANDYNNQLNMIQAAQYSIEKHYGLKQDSPLSEFMKYPVMNDDMELTDVGKDITTKLHIEYK